MAKTMSGMDQGDEHKRTIDEVSKYQRCCQNCGYLEVRRISPEGACLLSGRQPVYVLLKNLHSVRKSYIFPTPSKIRFRHDVY